MARNHRSSARPAPRPVTTYPEYPPMLIITFLLDCRAPPRRKAHTAAAAAPSASAPIAAPPQPVHAPQREGIATQILTTAAGVATGHVMAKMVTGLFSGSGGESAPAEQSPVVPSVAPSQMNVAPRCQEYSKLFLQCMEQNGNQVGTCQDYMDMMKACQQQYA